VVVYLPDESQVDPCPADWAEAKVVVTPITPAGPLGHHRQNVCVPHPPKAEITGRPYTVLEGEAPRLGRWTPLLFHAWMVRTGHDDDGRLRSAIDLDKNLVVHVHFGAEATLGFPDAPPPSLSELIAMPAIVRLIDDLGAVGGP